MGDQTDAVAQLTVQRAQAMRPAMRRTAPPAASSSRCLLSHSRFASSISRRSSSRRPSCAARTQKSGLKR